MGSDLIHIYMMPGMAANPSIFEYIKLPQDQFKIHWLEWMMPKTNEPLQRYAKRMCDEVKHKNPVLLGVSFGGILVQEMAKFIEVRKLIVVSSVKSKHELPRRMKLAKFTKAYKILPTQLLGNVDVLKKIAYGKSMNKRVDLYEKYLSVNDKRYLDWAIEKVVTWDQEEPFPGAIYIHGDKDMVFTHSCQGDCIVLEGGTHIMIINRFKWFNEHLPDLILG